MSYDHLLYLAINNAIVMVISICVTIAIERRRR